MALRAGTSFIQERYPVALMTKALEFLNVMTYDYNAGATSSLGSPLTGCKDPFIYANETDVDCVTTEFGALNSSTGDFEEGSWSECFGLCDGYNYG